MLPVSSSFQTAEAADVNLPAAKVYLILGNYFNASSYGTTVAASSVDGSGNYPAAGAIDGDRTELNIGLPANADNNVGKSSWRSTASLPATLTMTLTQPRTLNRIKIYMLSSRPFSSYDLQYYNGSSWVIFAATVDRVTGGQTPITTNETLDVIDFPDITATQWRLTVYTSGSGAADVVEIEGYRKVDISSRTKSIRVSRQRDFKLSNPMAATVQLELNNDDRFFSPSHTPTSAELSAGFVNTELRPNIQIWVQFGFNYLSLAPEYVNGFIGYMDRLTPKPKTRDATMIGRDSMKILINKLDSSKLKSNIDIATAIQYILNRADISTYETNLNTTGINVGYFFTDVEAPLDTIRDLTQAAGDALFYFDENGIAQFRFYTGSVNNSHTWTSQTDWNSGTLTHLDSSTQPGNLIVGTYGTVTDNFPNLTFWQSSTYPSNNTTWSVASGQLQEAFSGQPAFSSIMRADTSDPYGLGTWQFNMTVPSYIGADYAEAGFAFCVYGLDSYHRPNSGYLLRIVPGFGGSAGNIYLNKFTTTLSGPYGIYLAGATLPYDNSTHAVLITRASDGSITVTLDGVQIIQVVDNSYNTSNYCGFYVYEPSSAYYSSSIIEFDTLSIIGAYNYGTWASATYDMGASVTSLGLLTETTAPFGGSITNIQTRTSPDGTTWSSWAYLLGMQMMSPVNRYIQVTITFTFNLVLDDLTIYWVSGGGTPKYPPTSVATIAFNSTMMDIQQEIADNLGGDTAILNDISVQAEPYILTGNTTDTVYQGTVGIPPVAISVSNPLSVTNGQVITVAPYISGGMDISYMSGANPAALVVTFAASGAGSWVCLSIHPTLPVFQITITHTGTITDLRVVGQTFQNDRTSQIQTASDATSIANYGDRQLTIQNSWIVSSSVAATIASAVLGNYKNPVSYIPACSVRPYFALQIGDRLTINDDNLDLNADYISIGMDHEFTVSGNNAQVGTSLKLLKVP